MFACMPNADLPNPPQNALKVRQIKVSNIFVTKQGNTTELHIAWVLPHCMAKWF